MIICMEFDGVLISDEVPFDVVDSTKYRMLRGARDGLASLRRAGHTLILSSTRASRALRDGPHAERKASYDLHEA